MRQMTLTEVKHTRAVDLIPLLPVEVTVDAEVVAILAPPTNLISLVGLNPFMQARLRNIEKIARLGMPPADNETKGD